MANFSSYRIFLLSILLSFSFSQVPNWDCDGDGVLDNFNDYQNNGSITLAVFLDGVNAATVGDAFSAFGPSYDCSAGDGTWSDVNGNNIILGDECVADGGIELRGAGALTIVPDDLPSPYIGQYLFLTLIIKHFFLSEISKDVISSFSFFALKLTR